MARDSYSLRLATNEDRQGIENLVFGVLAEYGLSPDPNGTDADLHDLEHSYHRTGGDFTVLVDQAQSIVGSVGLAPVGHGTCELRKMYLARTTRGQGCGR